MNQLLRMDIVQGFGHLPDVRDNDVRRYGCALRVALPQGAIGSILHNEKRQTIFYLKVQHAHDMGMYEARHRARLAAQLLLVLISEVGMQHFDGRLSAQVQVLSQVDLSKAPSPDQMKQAIVAKLLSYTVAHPRTSSGRLM